MINSGKLRPAFSNNRDRSDPDVMLSGIHLLLFFSYRYLLFLFSSISYLSFPPIR